jgi:hypothetical protein
MQTGTACDDLHFNEFATQMVLIALCNPDLKTVRGTFHTDEFGDEIESLRLTPLQRTLLFDSIAFAKRLPHLYKPAPPAVLNRISTRIDGLLEELFT